MQITPAAKKARNSQLEEYNFNFFKFEKKVKLSSTYNEMNIRLFRVFLLRSSFASQEGQWVDPSSGKGLENSDRQHGQRN